MIYVIRCDCGTDMKAPTEDEVVEQGVEHARDSHSMTVTPEQVRPLVEAVSE